MPLIPIWIDYLNVLNHKPLGKLFLVKSKDLQPKGFLYSIRALPSQKMMSTWTKFLGFLYKFPFY